MRVDLDREYRVAGITVREYDERNRAHLAERERDETYVPHVLVLRAAAARSRRA